MSFLHCIPWYLQKWLITNRSSFCFLLHAESYFSHEKMYIVTSLFTFTFTDITTWRSEVAVRNQKVSLFITRLSLWFAHNTILIPKWSPPCVRSIVSDIRGDITGDMHATLISDNIFSHPSKNGLNFVGFFWKREIWMLQVNGGSNFGHLSENGLNFVLQCHKRPIPFYATRYAKALGFNISWISINKGNEINK